MRIHLQYIAQYLLPHRLLSVLCGRLAQSQHQLLKSFLIRRFIRYFQVDMTESARAEHDFPHFNAFFTRHLKPLARPIDPHAQHLVSPCDGRVLDYGQLNPQASIQVKGHPFHLAALLGGQSSPEELEHLSNSHYAIFYLAPRDYHRVHLPYPGKLERTLYVPGKLFSVSPAIVQRVDQVFARNERLICYFSSDQGPMIIIFVGAMIVSGIRTVWRANSKLGSNNTVLGNYASRQLCFQKGQEIGHFELGSSVIVLSPFSHLSWRLHKDQFIRMGEMIASLGSDSQIPI